MPNLSVYRTMGARTVSTRSANTNFLLTIFHSHKSHRPHPPLSASSASLAASYQKPPIPVDTRRERDRELTRDGMKEKDLPFPPFQSSSLPLLEEPPYHRLPRDGGRHMDLKCDFWQNSLSGQKGTANYMAKRVQARRSRRRCCLHGGGGRALKMRRMGADCRGLTGRRLEVLKEEAGCWLVGHRLAEAGGDQPSRS